MQSREKWDIKYPIKLEMLKVMPVKGLQSRNALGVLFTFVDYMEEVVPLLQIISHETRAYIWNANGLHGFLVKQPVMSILEDEDSGGLAECTKQ